MSLKEPSSFLPVASRCIIALAALLTLALLNWLPYRVPVAPNFSDSYLFGYSNHAALMLVAVFALTVALLAARTGRVSSIATPDQPMSRSTLAKALWLTGALALPLHLIVRRTGGYVESPYFLDRIKLVLDGRVPYRDFEYAYGASFLYLPAWLARILHLQVADAYGIVWAIVNLVGIWMLFFTIQHIPAPRTAKRGIFLFLFAMSVLGLLCTGVNYSTFRFILPLFLALFLHRKLQSANNSTVQVILLIAPCFVALLLVSPEMAISFAIGMVCYLAVFADLRSNLTSFAATLLLLGIAACVASRLGVFRTLNAFRSGGFNFPVMPSAPIILFLAAIAITCAFAGIHLRAKQASSLMVLIAVSAVTIASALGRCDAGHILLNPLGIWISALALSACRPIAARTFLGICTLAFFLLPLIFGLRGVVATPARAALLTLYATNNPYSHDSLDQHVTGLASHLYGAEKAGLKLDEARRFAKLHDGLDLSSIYGYPPHTVFNAPFQFAPEQYGPIHTSQADTGYFYGVVNLVTPEEVRQKVAELEARPERPLLLPRGGDTACDVSAAAERASLQAIFLYPYAAPVRHPESILSPICAFIRQHYVLVQPATPDHLEYAVWEPRAPTPTLQDVLRPALHDHQ